MKEEINRNIDDDEILVRIIFSPSHYSRSKKKFIYKEIFVPLRGGVSLNRYRHSDEDFSKRTGLEIQNPPDSEYKGVALFTRNIIFSEWENYLQSTTKEYFKLEIIATPLDEKGNIIPESIRVYEGDEGNPAHADMIYTSFEENVLNEPSEIRAFSKHFGRSLETRTLLILDPNPNEVSWMGRKFSSYF